MKFVVIQIVRSEGHLKKLIDGLKALRSEALGQADKLM